MHNISGNSNNKSIENTLSISPVMSQSNIASQLADINSVGAEGALPKNNIEGSTNISGDVNQLHNTNHTAQIDNITDLLFKVDPSINKDMVRKVLDAGNHGSSAQQELNHRLESALVVLTLFDNIPQSVLSAAVKSVQKFDKIDLNNDKHVSDMLNTVQKKLDKQLNNFLSSMEGDVPNNLATRYQEKYVDPAIKKQLSEYSSDDVLNSHLIDQFLLTIENVRLENSINNSIKEYNKVGNKHYGDKYQHLNNIFRDIEHKVEFIRPLKVGMTLNEPMKQELPSVQTSDEIDGLPYSMKTSPSGNISNSYNTTTTNNYFTSSFGDNISGVSQTSSETTETQATEQQPSVVKDERSITDNLKNEMFRQQKTAIASIKLPVATSRQLNIEPEIDYNIEPNNQIIRDEVDGFSSKHSMEISSLSFKPEVTLQKQDNSFDPMRQDVLDESRFLSGKKQIAGERKQNESENIKPLGNMLIGNRYQKDENNKWVIASPSTQKTVTLSANGALTRNQSDKEIYSGVREGQKTVVDMTSHLPNSSSPVTLTERGALTRDQSKKDAYTTE